MKSKKEPSFSGNKYVHNPDLSYPDLPFEWKGTPLDRQGKFVNHEHRHIDSFREVLKWQLSKNPQKTEKKNEKWRLEVMYNHDFLNTEKDCLVWLGHASFFIRLAGVSLLIDPVLFNVSLLKRKADLPVDPRLLKGLDYILVSHDHRDHCDVKSLQLLAHNNPGATYLTGLKLDGLLNKITNSRNIQTAGWYQQYATDERIRIYYVPSRHWGRRFLHDINRNLWGGYVIRGAGRTIYFSGDSGYGSHFSDIARIFPEIDYSLIGIGAYKPEFFMAQSHLSPVDAVRAFHDTGAKYMIPMHYGTFDLSDEPLGDPVQTLREVERQKEVKGKISYLKPGELLFPAAT